MRATLIDEIAMNDLTLPHYLKDAAELLSSQGFRQTGKWYHGTASGLVNTILAQGLRGTGDILTLQKQMETLGTIGHQGSDHRDPLFITQSKELAYFWALQKAGTRNLYFRQDETAVVFEMNLPPELQAQVTTDVGGAAMLLEPGNLYLSWLKELYQYLGFSLPELNPFSCDRMDYLNKLGLAYINVDVPAPCLRLIQG
jgi:hypothetical protein